LIEACPGLRVLVTSQEPLDVTGEQVVVIDPLIVPTDDADATTMATAPAVQLFLERAAAIGVGIEETSIPTVAAIVRRLDGLPLAIELAAARTRGLGVQDILRHLDARFEL